MLSRLFGGRRPTFRGEKREEESPFGKSSCDFSPKTDASRAASLPEVIESLGTGPYQIRTSLLAGPVWFADGAELLLISSVTDAVSKQWGLTAAERGLVVTFVYLGVLLGNLTSGPFGDRFGRRLPILLSYLLIFIFSVCSALAWGFWSLGFFRLLVGASIGLGQPAQQALVSEVSPTKWRVIFSSAGQYLFSLGEVYSGLLLLADDPMMKDLHWRGLLVAGAAPTVIFGFLALFFLDQSPLYLACTGRYAETQAILESIRRDNSAGAVSIEFRPSPMARDGGQPPFSRMLRIVFGPDYCTTSVVMIASCFVVNLAFYGSLYAFPNVLTEGVDMGSTPAAGLIYGALMELVGISVAVLCILYFRRILVMRSAVVMMGLALTAFAVGAPKQGGGPFMKLLTLFGYYGTKFFTAIAFVIFYLYTSEVYPTTVRATGTAVAFMGGRLGAMLSSLFYELITNAFGHYSVFFWLMAGACFVNFLLHGLLTRETYGQVLNDAEDSMEDDTFDDDESPRPTRYGGT